MSLTATPFAHGEIALEWTLPLGTWDRLRLVRSQYGTPVNEDDGTVLLDVNCGPSAAIGYTYPLTPTLNQIAVVQPQVTSYVDNMLTASTIYYYSLFIQQVANLPTISWTDIGDAQAFSVGDSGGQMSLLQALPGVYTSPGEMAGQPDPDSDLGNYLSLFGFDQDLDNEFIDGLALVRSPAEMNGRLLTAAAPMLGYTYEQAIGMRQNREILQNAAFLNQVKGTWTGILGLASSATSWGALEGALVNLFPNDDATIGQTGVDLWVPGVDSTLGVQIPPVSPFFEDPSIINGNFAGTFGALDTSPQVANFAVNGAGLNSIAVDNTFFMSGTGSMKMTWNNGSGGGLGLGANALAPVTGFTVGQTYTASVWVWNSPGQNKVYLGRNGGAFGTSTTLFGQWQQLTLTFVATATTHSFAVGMLTSTAGWTNWVDQFQVNLGSSPTAFTTTEPGRCFALQDVTTANLASMTYNPGSGSGPILFGIPVTVGIAYTFSGWASLQNAGSTVVYTPTINWYDATGAPLSPSVVGTATSTPGTVSSWGQFSVSGSPPIGAIYANVSIACSTIGVNQMVYFTCFQFEPHSAASTFQRARQLNITMLADRINNVLNAGFNVDVTQWGTNDTTTSLTTTTTYNRGAGAMLCVPSIATEPPLYPGPTTFPGATTYPGGGLPAVFAQALVDPGAPFTFACQINPVGTAATFQLSIKWVNTLGTVIQTDTASVITCQPGAWTRAYLQTTVPITAIAGNLIITQTTATPVNWVVDDVLGEETSVLQNFFDPNINGSNVLWEGTAWESRSHFYEHWLSRSSRLLTLLPLQVPMSFPFQVLYAQPAPPRGTYGFGIYGDGIYGL